MVPCSHSPKIWGGAVYLRGYVLVLGLLLRHTEQEVEYEWEDEADGHAEVEDVQVSAGFGA